MTERVQPTILDVARAAGVSPATVSRSLRGLPHVSDATRARVLRSASDLSYVVSPAASGLASGRTATIGVVVPFVTRWFFAQVIAGAGSIFQDHGYDLLLYNLGSSSGRDRFFERMPLRRRVDAVLLVSLPLDREQVAAVQALGVPVVAVGEGSAPFPRVRIDDAAASGRAVQYLVNLGHRAVAMIAALDDDDLGFTTSQKRRDGYARALPHGAPDHFLVEATWGLGGGASAMEELLSMEPLPSAVFVEYDEMAFGALRTLRRAGLHVPGDISVMGFDDQQMSDVADLTTVAQPVREHGEIAARMLMDLLRGWRVEEDVVLPTHLVVRGSTGPPDRQLSRAGEQRVS